ncbi:MAG: TraR/DksA C4-type zinc finger protein [Alicyclobacillus mali]|uniref:TraR/DksA C4-type zinc finger protein n=1 Tax=Alicyclobacillus mali (ex Roth et al. 2021) TaxID=1123961 RepID=UPI001A8E94C1|nr:TraR/DksA C4-type zinc finger protein [Alicyclobacillus mali (ex Roth et al. 2021)]MCL6488806.1 TraR/DksA C4-type zinc finger protein [Alicyclobacillus mali (ex Roth et al. 2021)]
MDTDLLQSRLEAEQRRLVARLQGAETSADIRSSMPDEFSELAMYDNHPADIASELALRSQAMGERLRDERALADVEDALARIRQGTYGTCESCGRSIPPERLEAVPTARRCVDCEREAEARRAPARRPVEEDVLAPSFGQFDRDGADETGYDGEDALQDVMRYDRPVNGLARYDEPDLDDDAGYVDPVERFSEEAYRRTLPSSAQLLTDYDEP